ncbi:MurR/RpiR family transcriptional regulator [Vibrio lamellibrachiae]|uniref:MurR/RpiR family transcriptional regulator n=1 Tax=Vibrio lamellibrachiae TaxID=2910253 RepID=UPI003D0A9D7B
MNRQEFIKSVNTIDALTESEKQIVEYFTCQFEMLPFAKINDLCSQIGIGKATLGRFLQRLGFNGFLDFKKAVTDDLILDLSIPIDRCNNKSTSSSLSCLIEEHKKELLDNIEETYRDLNDTKLEQATTHLLNDSGKLYVIGSASAEALANYFYLLARYLRNDVVLLKADSSTLPHQLADVTDKDTLLALSYHRFSTTSVKVVRWFSNVGGKTVVITDQEVNPFVSYSDIQIRAASESSAIFNNRAAGFSIIELLIKSMSNRSNDKHRFDKMEGLFKEFSIFKNNV